MPRRAASLAVAVIFATLAACGGGSNDPEDVVRDFADAVSGSDAEKLCQDILSDEAKEQLSGSTGENADDQCEQELSRNQGQQLEIRRIVSTKERGDEATVIAEIEQGRAVRRQVFRLKKEDGDFRLTGL